jgi:hypothetical protein
VSVRNPKVSFCAGDGKKFEFKLVDAAGVPLNMTGKTLRWALSRKTPSTGRFETALVVKQHAAFSIDIGEETIATLQLEAVDTQNLLGSYEQQLEIIEGGRAVVSSEGEVEIRANIPDA